MADRLKIYACSGIGENAESQEQLWQYWSDNTDCISNTQAVNTLLLLINRNYIEITRLAGMTREDKIANLNDIDVYVLSLHAAQHCAQHYKKLEKAGAVIGDMLMNGAFDLQSLNAVERDANLDSLFDKFEELYSGDHELAENPEFEAWFNENVVERNKVGLSSTAQATVKKSLKTAKIGASGDYTENADLAKYFADSGTYFLYTYFTDEQLAKLPRIFSHKKRLQMKTYNYCKSLYVDVYGSEAEMREIIRMDIVNRFEQEPESVCAGIASGDVRPIGSLTLFGLVGAEAVKALLALIAAIASVLVALITSICDVVAKKNNEKYASINETAVQASMPTETDYAGFQGTRTTNVTKAGGNLWTYLLLGGAALGLILSKNK